MKRHLAYMHINNFIGNIDEYEWIFSKHLFRIIASFCEIRYLICEATLEKKVYKISNVNVEQSKCLFWKEKLNHKTQ